jgi:uncharacterized protein YfaP (DUF2135 family)
MTNYLRLTISLITALSLEAACAYADSPSDAPQLKTPHNGWRPTVEKGGQYTQPVHYPAASVSTPEGQADTARIRGVIASTPKNATGPATLIVNGVPMPLSINEDGSFDRPYIFPAGSNNLEVRDASQQARRVQFYQKAGNQTTAQLRIVLSWNSDNTDLDLHVITPDGEHAWYGNRVLKNGGAQDVDVTTGYGPEIFSSPSPLPGQYLVYVNEKIDSTLVPMRAAGELNFVKRFNYP